MRSLLVLFAMSSAICSSACVEEPSLEATPATANAVEVWEIPVTREHIAVSVFGTGTVIAEKTSDIGPRIDGIIDEILVRVGDRVESGDTLFRTRDTDYRFRVDESRQVLRLAEAEAGKARRDFDRVKTLAKQGVASVEQLDAARTADDIASARLGSARTALRQARQNLSDTRVTAPYAGVITDRRIDEGVMMRTMPSANAYVVQLMKTDVVEAIVDIPAVHLSQVRCGTAAILQIDGLAEPREGIVKVLNHRVDSSSRAFEVRIPIENADLEIKPGLFVRAELQVDPKPSLVIERRAVLGNKADRHVFISEGSLAVKRSVKVRDLDASRLEVISGLVAGERVLVGPSLPRLVDGSAIAVRTAHVDL